MKTVSPLYSKGLVAALVKKQMSPSVPARARVGAAAEKSLIQQFREMSPGEIKNAVLWDGTLLAGMIVGGVAAYRARSPWVAATYGAGAIGLAVPAGMAGFVAFAPLMIVSFGLAAGGATAVATGFIRGVVGLLGGKAKS